MEIPKEAKEIPLEPYAPNLRIGRPITMSTYVDEDIARLAEIVLDSRYLGYETRSELLRDALVKWLLILTERLRSDEAMTISAKIRATLNAARRRARAYDAEEFVNFCADELYEVMELDDDDAPERLADIMFDHWNQIYGLPGKTAKKIWFKKYASHPIIAAAMQRSCSSEHGQMLSEMIRNEIPERPRKALPSPKGGDT